MKKIIITTAIIASLWAGFHKLGDFMKKNSGVYGAHHRILQAENFLKK